VQTAVHACVGAPVGFDHELGKSFVSDWINLEVLNVDSSRTSKFLDEKLK